MVMCSKDAPRSARSATAGNGHGARHGSDYGDGGPVFVPSRELSPMAQALLSAPAGDERVTAYDELWYLGRPQQA